MGLGDVQEASVNRRIEREVERSTADTAGEGAAQGLLKIASTEREKGFRIGEKEPCRQFITAAVEFTVPVRGELIIGVTAGAADGKESGGGITAGNQVAVGSAAKLIAFEIEQANGDWVQAGNASGKAGGKKLGDQGGF